MLFEVTTSYVPSEEKPCDGCVLMPIAIPYGRDIRYLKRNYADRVGDSVVTVWGIEINSLEELVKLSEKVGYDLILTTSYVDNKTPRIMIYDDYIE